MTLSCQDFTYPNPSQHQLQGEVLVVPEGEGGKPPARAKQWHFDDGDKPGLYDWLVEVELIPCTNKLLSKNTDTTIKLLTDKAAEYTHGDNPCSATQLYSFFKSNRKLYTDWNTLISKSGSEADVKLLKPHTPLQKKIIQIYTTHAKNTGSVPVHTTTRNTQVKSKYFKFNF